jgi:hypothetical protein
MFFNLPDLLKPGRRYSLFSFPPSQVKWHQLLDGGEPGRRILQTQRTQRTLPQHEPAIAAQWPGAMLFSNRIPP